MECLHRFCRECIDKSMRLGNNECPSCRTHCASRRSLRDDPNFDALIALLYPDLDKYEEQEFSLHEEETASYKLTQDSIDEHFRRQTGTESKKRTREQSLGRRSRTRRSRRAVEPRDGSDEGTNGHEGSKDSHSADELSIDMRPKRSRRSRSSQPSSGGNISAGSGDKDSGAEIRRLLRGREIIKWARVRIRTYNRRPGLAWAGVRLFSEHEKLQKLRDHIHGLDQSNEMKIDMTVVSLNEKRMPSLQRPYLRCSPKMSVGQICQYVSMQTTIEANEIEMLIVIDSCPPVNSPLSIDESGIFSSSLNRKLELLQEHLTLEEVNGMFLQQNLVLGYQHKSKPRMKKAN